MDVNHEPAGLSGREIRVGRTFLSVRSRLLPMAWHRQKCLCHPCTIAPMSRPATGQPTERHERPHRWQQRMIRRDDDEGSRSGGGGAIQPNDQGVGGSGGGGVCLREDEGVGGSGGGGVCLRDDEGVGGSGGGVGRREAVWVAASQRLSGVRRGRAHHQGADVPRSPRGGEIVKLPTLDSPQFPGGSFKTRTRRQARRGIRKNFGDSGPLSELL